MTEAASTALPPPLADSPSGPEDPAAARILAAARAHFLRFGFATCSMETIARQVGMSKKTLYQHFRSKDALVEAVLAAKIAGFRDGVLAILENPDIAFAERARQVTAHVVAQMSEVAPVFLRDLERLMPALYARIESVRGEVLPRVWGRILEEGVALGHVRPEPSRPLVAEMALLAVDGLLRPAVLDRLQLAPGDVIRDVLSTIFAGILTPAGREAYENKNRA